MVLLCVCVCVGGGGGVVGGGWYGECADVIETNMLYLTSNIMGTQLD